MKPLHSVCLIALFTACFPAFAQPHWSRFRGPDGTGHGQAKGLPAVLTEANIAWKVKLPGGGPSSPVIFNDRIFLTGVPEDEAGKRLVFALEAKTGKLIWQKEFGFTPYRQHKHNNYASSSVTADADALYLTWTDEETRYALALDHDGHSLWRTKVGFYSVNHGSGGSPEVIGDTVLISNVHEAPGGFICGLDRKTGEEKWRVERGVGKAPFCTPAPFRPEGGKTQALFVSVPGGITSVDPDTGKILWETGQLFQLRTVALPVVVEGNIFAISGSGRGGKLAAMVQPGHADEKPEVLWKRDKSLPYVPTPVADDGLLYLWSDGGIGTLLDAKTGEEIYQERIGGDYYASPVLVDGKLYSISREGELVCIAAGREFKLLGRTDLGERSDASPAVAFGRLYLRTMHHLICVKPSG